MPAQKQPVEVRETELPGVLVIEPVVHADERGYFLESWRAGAYAGLGLPGGVVQDNLVPARRGGRWPPTPGRERSPGPGSRP